MHTEHSVIIARPIDEVFAFVANPSNETRWQPEILSVDIGGPLGLGMIFQEARVSFGRRFDWHFRITRFEPPHIMSIDTIAGPLLYRGSRIFEAIDADRTMITEIAELRLPWFARMFDPLMTQLAKRPIADAHGRLRTLLEADPAGGDP